jgi:competence ComEA-like helix-hairpin-helix protein
LAERILKYRTEHGKFNSYEDLLKVPGIGGAKLEKFRSYLVVK